MRFGPRKVAPIVLLALLGFTISAQLALGKKKTGKAPQRR